MSLWEHWPLLEDELSVSVGYGVTHNSVLNANYLEDNSFSAFNFTFYRYTRKHAFKCDWELLSILSSYHIIYGSDSQ